MKFNLCALVGLFYLLPSASISADAAAAVLHDLNYLEEGRSEKLDLYLPASSGRKLVPAVVWIHGGGWTGGDKAQAREKNIGHTLAQAGYVVASINYRLGVGAWPQNLLDCKNAVRFLRAHAAQYGLDPNRIAVAGGSAGGHLALMVAFTAEQAWEPATPYRGGSNAVQAVIDFYGPTNLLTRAETNAEGQPTGMLKAGNTALVFGGSREGDAQIWQRGSPVHHVRNGLPPVFIAHGDKDATVDLGQSIELAEVLQAAKVPHQFVIVKNAGHTFDLETWNKQPLSLDLRASVIAFLAQHLPETER
ncbi:MAG: alpha/beta hydrolase [Opitutae bacterium]|nr:alpha/beta hydrolase [Opitutae bacterium]